ncbi:MAG: hypothetical protein LBT01_02705 [Spirochaetaceae bacterium]|jgi:hypothetical protein|nr:hypothetical protein [Spirochaetaceae bacterium]
MAIEFKNQPFCNDLNCAIVFLRPVLKSLSIRKDNHGVPVFLAQFSHLLFLDGVENWIITLLRADLSGRKSMFLSSYKKISNEKWLPERFTRSRIISFMLEYIKEIKSA